MIVLNLSRMAWLVVFCLSVDAWLPPENPKIFFRNPSFEGKGQSSTIPEGWVSSNGSTPDILPGAWGLDCSVHDGKTCLGLVTREDGSREDVSQALGEPLKKDQCYAFSLHLAHLSKYVGYNQAVRLRVWGGSSKGSKEQLLDASPLIEHTDWKQYKFQFTPKTAVKYITFEAYFAPGVLFKYKGNILLDLCSPIEQCDRA
jgi:hypothetical protein